MDKKEEKQEGPNFTQWVKKSAFFITLKLLNALVKNKTQC